MITSRHIDSGLGSSALKEGFIDHPRYDSNISRSVPIVDIQNLVNEFKVTDRVSCRCSIGRGTGITRY